MGKAKKISKKDAHLAVSFYAALEEMPNARKRLSNKSGKYHDSICLQLMPAEMVDGVGQGGSHCFYLPPALGREVLDAVQEMILRELSRLNVKRPKT